MRQWWSARRHTQTTLVEFYAEWIARNRTRAYGKATDKPPRGSPSGPERIVVGIKEEGTLFAALRTSRKVPPAVRAVSWISRASPQRRGLRSVLVAALACLSLAEPDNQSSRRVNINANQSHVRLSSTSRSGPPSPPPEYIFGVPVSPRSVLFRLLRVPFRFIPLCSATSQNFSVLTELRWISLDTHAAVVRFYLLALSPSAPTTRSHPRDAKPFSGSQIKHDVSGHVYVPRLNAFALSKIRTMLFKREYRFFVKRSLRRETWGNEKKVIAASRRHYDAK